MSWDERIGACRSVCNMFTAGHAESRVPDDERNITTDLDDEGRRECSK